jgi:hypothetical protein
LTFIQPKTDCEGLSGGPIPGSTPLSVNRKSYDWPYAADNVYSIAKPTAPPDAPYEVSLTVNMVADPKMDPEKRKELLSKIGDWEKKTEEFFNCQSGASSKYVPSSSWFGFLPWVGNACPPDSSMKRSPGLKFSIKLRPTDDNNAPEPRVNLHECYNADMVKDEREDCDKIKTHQINRCIERGASQKPELGKAELTQFCEKKIADTTRDYLNREDSGNYTKSTKMGTVFHEVGHLLGLNDEYSDKTYPMNDLGEHSSLMNHSNENGSRLFPRHLDQILSPAIDCRKTEAPI